MVKLKKPDLLRMEMETCLRKLETLDPGTEEYTKVVDDLEKLYKMKVGDRKNLSPDTIVSAAVALTQVGMILWHEQLHAFTSKATSFIMKPRF